MKSVPVLSPVYPYPYQNFQVYGYQHDLPMHSMAMTPDSRTPAPSLDGLPTKWVLNDHYHAPTRAFHAISKDYFRALTAKNPNSHKNPPF